MKPGIHPVYKQTTVTCACGAVYHVGSTKEDIRVEICARCHPFYTGKQRVVTTGGRVERFLKRYEAFQGSGGKPLGKKKRRKAARAAAEQAEADASSGADERRAGKGKEAAQDS